MNSPTLSYYGYKENAERFLTECFSLLFPNYFLKSRPLSLRIFRKNQSRKIKRRLRKCLKISADKQTVNRAISCFFKTLPILRKRFLEDAEFSYAFDPACKDRNEVILTYPSFFAVGTYRLAHEFYEYGFPVFARALTEYAHRKTGIDIHPGAKIGRRFFIDHGTGVVVGETCEIGDGVRLYHNVTLGAKSFVSESDGSIKKGEKRHPTLKNGVVVYAGATILGGDVIVGENAVVGGNVILTHSVGENEKITRQRE